MRVDAQNLAWENMQKGIDGQAAVLREAPGVLYRHAQEALQGRLPTKIYMTGCGDSYFCGIATRYAMERITGIGVEAVESLEFSRYGVRSAPPGSLVVGVSNSGEVSRTVEALGLAREAGLQTIGVTYDPKSRLAEKAEKAMSYDYRDVGFGPGTMSYVASILSLLAVGLGVGVLAGRMDDCGVNKYNERIRALGTVVEDTVRASVSPALEVAGHLSASTPLFVLGAGPNYGTALFVMAKMIESARHNTVAQELEEWAHEQYFCCGPGTVTMIIAPPGASTDRAREQLQAVRDMKGTAVAVCAQTDNVTAELADIVVPVAGAVEEELSPLVYLVAGELISMNVGMGLGRVMLGFDDDWRREVNFRQIFRSAIVSDMKSIGSL